MTDGLVLMVATDAFISAGTTSPRKRRHEARYWESGPRGSHLIMKLAGSKAAAEICGGVRLHHEVETRVRHQVRLELVEVDVEVT